VAEKAISYLEAAAIAHDKALYFDDAGPDATEEVIDWLTRLRLLNGVPFAYLIAHERFLPPESMRFFYLDRNWTDAAVDGALSVGTITSRDRAQLHSVYATLRARLDQAERQAFQRLIRTLPTVAADGRAEVTTGFLLRSRAVSGWPGMHVNAFKDNTKDTSLGIIRIERLAPAVLLVLFDGIPGFLTLTEPRQGIQFGVDVDPNVAGKRRIKIRDTDGTGINNDTVFEPVPFRDGSPGVIHWAELARRIQSHTGGTVSSAQVGLQMLRFPFEQQFGRSDDAPSTFVATFPIELLAQTWSLEDF
jgi:hypothetical protein